MIANRKSSYLPRLMYDTHFGQAAHRHASAQSQLAILEDIAEVAHTQCPFELLSYSHALPQGNLHFAGLRERYQAMHYSRVCTRQSANVCSMANPFVPSHVVNTADDGCLLRTPSVDHHTGRHMPEAHSSGPLDI